MVARRTRIAGLVNTGQRIGYSLFGIALVVFFVGFAAGFTGAVVAAIVTCLVVGSAVLAPAIVLGHAVRAADRADREGTWN